MILVPCRPQLELFSTVDTKLQTHEHGQIQVCIYDSKASQNANDIMHGKQLHAASSIDWSQRMTAPSRNTPANISQSMVSLRPGG